MKGILQKSNLNSIERQDKKVIRSRLITDIDTEGNWYEVDTWLDKDNRLKITLYKHTPRNTDAKYLVEDEIISELF